MARDNENKNANWSSKEISSIGEVMIADDVIATIAGKSALEVKGVYSMAGGFAGGIFPPDRKRSSLQ